jgi:hypothetical protein
VSGSDDDPAFRLGRRPRGPLAAIMEATGLAGPDSVLDAARCPAERGYLDDQAPPAGDAVTRWLKGAGRLASGVPLAAHRLAAAVAEALGHHA